MADPQIRIQSQVTVQGIPTSFTLIQNPTIDDVLIGEMRVQATSIETNNTSLLQGRVVPRAIRNFLIDIGVEQ